MPLRNLSAEVAENVRIWIRGVVRFAGAGIGGFLILLGGTAFLVEFFDWKEPTAYALMLGMVSVLNFVMQQRFVFKKRQFEGSPVIQGLRFLGTTMFFRGLEWTLFTLLVTYSGFHYTLVATLTTMLLFFGKYVTYDRWVFKKKKPESSMENSGF